MPTFFTIDGVKINLYFRDHMPPHFHAVLAEYEALIEIQTCKILKGELPKNKRKTVFEWAEQNTDVLMEIWESLR